MLGWAEGGGNTVSVRLITGPGGAGKTRLAAGLRGGCGSEAGVLGFLLRNAPHGAFAGALKTRGLG